MSRIAALIDPDQRNGDFLLLTLDVSGIVD
jgi:hypothetical protein